jgi:hypothetical protein
MDHKAHKDPVVDLPEQVDLVEYKAHKALLALLVSVDKVRQDHRDLVDHSLELYQYLCWLPVPLLVPQLLLEQW